METDCFFLGNPGVIGAFHPFGPRQNAPGITGKYFVNNKIITIRTIKFLRDEKKKRKMRIKTNKFFCPPIFSSGRSKVVLPERGS